MTGDKLIDRDPRSDAPIIGMDLTKPTADLQRLLVAKFRHHGEFWWELEVDEMTGWVYSPSSHVLAKLVHNGDRWGIKDTANGTWLATRISESDACMTADRWNSDYKTKYYHARLMSPSEVKAASTPAAQRREVLNRGYDLGLIQAIDLLAPGGIRAALVSLLNNPELKIAEMAKLGLLPKE